MSHLGAQKRADYPFLPAQGRPSAKVGPFAFVSSVEPQPAKPAQASAIHLKLPSKADDDQKGIRRNAKAKHLCDSLVSPFILVNIQMLSPVFYKSNDYRRWRHCSIHQLRIGQDTHSTGSACFSFPLPPQTIYPAHPASIHCLNSATRS